MRLDRHRKRPDGILAAGLVLAGLALITLAWRGAAATGHAVLQIPYLVSGGVGGLGLVIVGACVAVIQHDRVTRAEEHVLLSRLVEVSTPPNAPPQSPSD